MLYSNHDFYCITDPIDKKLMSQAQQFIVDNEEIIYTFDSTDIVAFFTNKKIIFVGNIRSKYFETDIVPYSSLIRCNVIGCFDPPYGMLHICINDDIVTPFYLPEYEDAVKLCRSILKKM